MIFYFCIPQPSIFSSFALPQIFSSPTLSFFCFLKVLPPFFFFPAPLSKFLVLPFSFYFPLNLSIFSQTLLFPFIFFIYFLVFVFFLPKPFFLYIFPLFSLKLLPLTFVSFSISPIFIFPISFLFHLPSSFLLEPPYALLRHSLYICLFQLSFFFILLRLFLIQFPLVFSILLPGFHVLFQFCHDLTQLHQSLHQICLQPA